MTNVSDEYFQVTLEFYYLNLNNSSQLTGSDYSSLKNIFGYHSILEFARIKFPSESSPRAGIFIFIYKLLYKVIYI